MFCLQRLTFTDFVNSTYVKEVQTLDIETGGEFRIGLFGVYTGKSQGRSNSAVCSFSLITV